MTSFMVFYGFTNKLARIHAKHGRVYTHGVHLQEQLKSLGAAPRSCPGPSLLVIIPSDNRFTLFHLSVP